MMASVDLFLIYLYPSTSQYSMTGEGGRENGRNMERVTEEILRKLDWETSD